MTSNRDWLHSAPLEEIYAWMDAEHEPSGDGAQSFAGKCDALGDDLMALQTEAIAKLQSEIAKRDKGIERLKKRRDELELRVNSLVAELGDAEGENLILRRQRDEARTQLDRKPTDAVREFAERYEQRIAELERELDTAYGALEIAVKNESRLERERDGWRMRCGELLDSAHAIQGVADAWDEEV